MSNYKISLERVKQLIDYNHETGEFKWLVKQGKARIGAPVGTVQNGYPKATIDKEQIRLPRLAWFMHYGEWPKEQIDHIDGNKLNNKIANLRDVSNAVNMQNRYHTKTKKSGLPYGIRIADNGRFQANIRIGTYDTLEEATNAFIEAKRLLHKGCTR